MYALLIVSVVVGLWILLCGIRNVLDARKEKVIGVSMANKSAYVRSNRILCKENQRKNDAMWRSRGTWN
jgi:hypothetical protein